LGDLVRDPLTCRSACRLGQQSFHSTGVPAQTHRPRHTGPGPPVAGGGPRCGGMKCRADAGGGLAHWLRSGAEGRGEKPRTPTDRGVLAESGSGHHSPPCDLAGPSRLSSSHLSLRSSPPSCPVVGLSRAQFQIQARCFPSAARNSAKSKLLGRTTSSSPPPSILPHPPAHRRPIRVWCFPCQSCRPGWTPR
jgi:hypothetical protein